MPSKEDIRVVAADTPAFLQADMEELVAAIKQNLCLKSRRSRTTAKGRLTPYAAPVRALCRAKTNSDQHTPSTCKFCILKSSAAEAPCPEDPYEILTYLRKGILISEAVKRLQMECSTTKSSAKKDFYADEFGNEFCDYKDIESV